LPLERLFPGEWIKALILDVDRTLLPRTKLNCRR